MDRITAEVHCLQSVQLYFATTAVLADKLLFQKMTVYSELAKYWL